MLDQILRKLDCSSIEEFFEREMEITRQFAGMEIERINPLLQLNDEEMDYFETEIFPNLKVPVERRSSGV